MINSLRFNSKECLLMLIAPFVSFKFIKVKLNLLLLNKLIKLFDKNTDVLNQLIFLST